MRGARKPEVKGTDMYLSRLVGLSGHQFSFGIELLVERDEIDAHHEGLQDLGHSDSVRRLVVLQNTAQRALSSSECAVQHVHKAIATALAALTLGHPEPNIQAP